MLHRAQRIDAADSEAVRERKLAQNAKSFFVLRDAAANVAQSVETIAQSIQNIETELCNIDVFSRSVDSDYNKLATRAFEMCVALVYEAHNAYFEFTNIEAQSACDVCTARNALSITELFEAHNDAEYACEAYMCNRHFDYEQAHSVVAKIFEEKMIDV